MRIQRYFAREILLAFAVSFLLFFFVFFLNQILLLAEDILKKRAPFDQVAILILAIPGSIVHLILGHIDLILALGLSAGSIPLAYLGANIAVRMRADVLKKLFAGSLVVFAAYFFYSQL